MKNSRTYIIALGVFMLLFVSDTLEAQRMRGGGRGAVRPATSRPATSRPAARPATRPAARPATRPTTRPTQTKPSTRPASRPQTNTRERPSNSSSRPTINGGSSRVTDRSKPSSRVESIQNNRGGNSIGNNNRVNINNNTNINVNIRNSNNRAYRPPYRPYPRPPYFYGGFGFSYFRPYYYHPYTPFYWGPVWHPWGFFAAALTVTAVAIIVDSQQYHYDQGVFYVEENDGYVVVEAPQGATVKVIPDDAREVEVSPTVNNYYYGNTYYEKSDGGYTVVPPPAGAVVDVLPEGGEEVKIGDDTFVKIGDTYYLPVQVDGKNMYEIASVEPEK